MVPTINRAKNISGQIVFVFRKNYYIRPSTMFEICPEAICRMTVNFVLPVCPIVLQFGLQWPVVSQKASRHLFGSSFLTLRVKGGRSLVLVISQRTAELVFSSYRSDQVRRVMPGKKNFVLVRNKISGKSEQAQKRHILWNLKEAYRLFKDTHPAHKMSFPNLRNCVRSSAWWPALSAPTRSECASCTRTLS